MRPALTRRAARSSDYTGPNWRGVGCVEVDADSGAGIGPGITLVVDFDRHHVAADGQYLVTVSGWPELLQFRHFTSGLRVRIGGLWVGVTDDDLRDMRVVGRVTGGAIETKHRCPSAAGANPKG